MSPSQPKRSVAPALAIVIALLLVAGGSWWFLRDDRDEGGPARAAPTRRTTDEATPAPTSVPGDATPLSPERTAEQIAPTAGDLGVRAAPESFTRELAGLRGRVIEQDGTPAANLDVELLRIHPDLFLQSLQGGFVEPPPELVRPEVATGKTGEDGRFVLHNAEAGALAILGIDLGGPRGTARLLDVALERGQSFDLGDIVLPAHVTFTGTVLDEDEKPIAGARVRVVPQLPTPIPTQVIEVGLQDIRNDCAGLFKSGKLAGMVEMPAWLRAGFDRLPLPTTRCDGDGRFKLPGVPTGLVTVLVDRPGFVGIVRAGVPTGRNPEHDVGTYRLSSGRTVTGRVLAGETPVAGARLFVGASIPFPLDDEMLIALGQPVATQSDAEGRFTITGLPLNGDLLCAVQPQPGDPWRVLGPFDRDDLMLELPATATLTVLVKDGAGAPVANAALRFAEDNEMQVFPILGPPFDLKRHVTEESEGRYVVRDVPIAKWKVLARAPDLGVAGADVELTASGAEVTIKLPPARAIAVHVVEAASGAPVDHALVAALVGVRHFLPMPFAVARCDPLGDATLTQLPAGEKIMLRVTHPGYAAAVAEVPDAVSEPIAIALLRGGDLAGVVSSGGKAPGKPMMLVLSRREHRNDLPENEFPRFAVTLTDGSYRVRHLPAGKWEWMVYPRFFFVDPMELVKTAMEEPDELAKGECVIEEGKETRLDVDAMPDGEWIPATVRGRVRVSGAIEEGLEVQLSGRRHLETKPDAAGRFEFTELKPGSWRLEVNRSGNGQQARLHFEQLELRSGDSKDVEIDVHLTEVTIHVTTRDGADAEHVDLQLTGTTKSWADGDRKGTLSDYARGRTDAKGRATLPLQAGAWQVSASHDELGRIKSQFEVVAGRDASLELVLDPGVRISGRFEFDGATPAGEQWHFALAMVDPENEDDSEFTTWKQLEQGEAHFEAKTMLPGRYHAILYTEDGMLRSENFDVGPNGNTDLVLRMRKHDE